MCVSAETDSVVIALDVIWNERLSPPAARQGQPPHDVRPAACLTKRPRMQGRARWGCDGRIAHLAAAMAPKGPRKLCKACKRYYLKEAARTLRQSYVDAEEEVRLEVVLDMGACHMRREME